MSKPYLSRQRENWIVSPDVRGVTLDSRQVRPGYVFCATVGRFHDGHQFIPDAIRAGAITVVGERDRSAVPELGAVPYLVVADARREAGRIASEFFGQPSRRLTVVGVTGTNGKTTVSYWLRHFLGAGLGPAGLSCSVMVDDLSERQRPMLTTPEGPDLQGLLNSMAHGGAVAAVIEVSSHALVQGRVAGVDFAGAVFTNLSRDHLDFHGTMTGYAEAKAGLFAQLGQGRPAVINADDPWGAWMAHHCGGPVITFGQAAGEVRWKILRSAPRDVTVQIRLPGCRNPHVVTIPFAGSYQAENLVAAYTMAWILGVSEQTLKREATRLPVVPGRQQRWAIPGLPTVIIDYAHNPQGLKALLEAVSQWRPAHVALVFGARGDRDMGKYPEMGRVASNYCQRIWVTTDSPGATPLERLTHAILDGISDPRVATVVLDRQEAITRALLEAGSHDVVIVTGRGHEGPMVLDGGTVVPPDQELVRRALAVRGLDARTGQEPGGRQDQEGGYDPYVRHCRMD